VNIEFVSNGSAAVTAISAILAAVEAYLSHPTSLNQTDEAIQ